MFAEPITTKEATTVITVTQFEEPITEEDARERSFRVNDQDWRDGKVKAFCGLIGPVQFTQQEVRLQSGWEPVSKVTYKIAVVPDRTMQYVSKDLPDTVEDVVVGHYSYRPLIDVQYIDTNVSDDPITNETNEGADLMPVLLNGEGGKRPDSEQQDEPWIWYFKNFQTINFDATIRDEEV
jgi:hypothetical protein